MMLRLRASAKLNLYLRVVGKRPDGYHELETLFERIDLADELSVEPDPHALRLTCDDASLPCDETNLVLQAARLLQRASHTRQGARIHLAKRIPIAAGLGGGSSDAAATLRGLNAVWRLGWDRARLHVLAAQLGSDVPFFLLEGAFAIGRGRGEVLEPVPATGRLAHVLVVPDERLSTREVFECGGFDLPRLQVSQSERSFTGGSGPHGDSSQDVRGDPGNLQRGLTAPKPSITMVQHALCNGPDLAGLAGGLWNDLAPSAIRRCPVIARIQASLEAEHCLGVLMSGSGSAVFGQCRDEPHAQAIATTLRATAPPSWRIELVHTDSEGHPT